jgi:cation diffusion facilitator family transporter
MAAHGSKTVIYAALAGNAAISASKFAASWFTGSSAMLSEAIHSLVDTGNQLLLLHGIRRAARPPSPEHPFGHGLQLYFWAFVVAILIFGLGAGLSIFEGIDKVRTPHPVESAWVNYVVLTLGLVFEGTVWVVALRAFRQEKGTRGWLAAIRASKDPTTFTVLFEDSAAMLGLMVALAGVYLSQALDMPVLDGVASIAIGLILAVTAAFLAYECQSLLTGEGVDPMVRATMTPICLTSKVFLPIHRALILLDADMDHRTAVEFAAPHDRLDKIPKDVVVIDDLSQTADAKLNGRGPSSGTTPATSCSAGRWPGRGCHQVHGIAWRRSHRRVEGGHCV